MLGAWCSRSSAASASAPPPVSSFCCSARLRHHRHRRRRLARAGRDWAWRAAFVAGLVAAGAVVFVAPAAMVGPTASWPSPSPAGCSSASARARAAAAPAVTASAASDACRAIDRRLRDVHGRRDDRGVRRAARRGAGVKAIVVGFAAGVLFGAGLAIARMTDPARRPRLPRRDRRVESFTARRDGRRRLDVRPALRLAIRRKTRSSARACASRGAAAGPPPVLGTTLFGIGWGLVGLCPGPAVTALSGGNGSGRVFVAAMIAGIAAASWSTQRRITARGHAAGRERRVSTPTTSTTNSRTLVRRSALVFSSLVESPVPGGRPRLVKSAQRRAVSQSDSAR